MNSYPITAQLKLDLKALLSDTDSTTSEKLDQMSQAFMRVTNQLEDKVRILSQVVCTPEIFLARKRAGIREESSRFIKAYELPNCWVWPGLVLWTGCFEGCWLLLVVLCPLARVLVG